MLQTSHEFNPSQICTTLSALSPVTIVPLLDCAHVMYPLETFYNVSSLHLVQKIKYPTFLTLHPCKTGGLIASKLANSGKCTDTKDALLNGMNNDRTLVILH